MKLVAQRLVAREPADIRAATSQTGVVGRGVPGSDSLTGGMAAVVRPAMVRFSGKVRHSDSAEGLHIAGRGRRGGAGVTLAPGNGGGIATPTRNANVRGKFARPGSRIGDGLGAPRCGRFQTVIGAFGRDGARVPMRRLTRRAR